MERSEFFKKYLTTGIVCGSALRMQAGAEFVEPFPNNKTPGQNETPCNEKMEFTHTWIKRFMDVMDQNLDADTAKKLMQINGSLCASGAYGELGEDKPHTKEEIVELLESLRSGGKACRFKVSI